MFFLERMYSSHRQSTENLSTKYSCPYCPYSSFFATNLQAHKRTHTGEKPFRCNICSKSFTQKVSLQTHFRSHTGERPFFCTYCKKGFTQKVNLKKHKCTSLTEDVWPVIEPPSNKLLKAESQVFSFETFINVVLVISYTLNWGNVGHSS